jgi:hypothetical protein
MKTMNELNHSETIINKFVNRSGLTFLLLLALLVSAGGCATGSRHDPLEGWKDLCTADIVKGCPFGQTIKDDYQNYIQKLPLFERSSVRDSNIQFYEGLDGQRAVKITTYGKGFIGGIWWEHILIYDSSDKRIKSIKHKVGRFLS